MSNVAKAFVDVLVGMIVIQIVAVVIAGLTNFSTTGTLIAGFIDVILMALLILGVAKKF